MSFKFINKQLIIKKTLSI